MSIASRRPAAASLSASPAAASKARPAGPAFRAHSASGRSSRIRERQIHTCLDPGRFCGRSQLHDLAGARAAGDPGIQPQTPQMTHLAACGEDRHLSRRRSALPVYIGQAGICRRGRGTALRAAPAHAGAVEQLLGLQLAVHRGAAHSVLVNNVTGCVLTKIESNMFKVYNGRYGKEK